MLGNGLYKSIGLYINVTPFASSGLPGIGLFGLGISGTIPFVTS